MIRDEIWDQMIEAECLVRYYDALTQRYRVYHKILRAVILLSSMTAIGALLEQFPPNVYLVIGALLAVAVVWDMLADYSAKSALLSVICMECIGLLNEWRTLWEDVNQEEINESSLRQRTRELAKRLTDVTSRAIPANIAGNKSLYEKEAEAAYQVVKDRYYVEETTV